MRRTPPNDEELDITPMIDVTFLLLIFFMVASTMQGKPDLPLPPATATEAIANDTAVVITLLAENGSPSIRLGDGPGAPQGTQEQVATFVKDGVGQQKTTLIIKADKELPSGFVEDVARAANVEGLTAMYYGVEVPRN